MPLRPEVKEIRVNSDQHKKLMSAIKDRLVSAKNEQDKRSPRWSQNEDIFQIYMPEPEADRIRKKERAKGQQNFTTVALPYSYATLLSAHTYYTSVFLGREPVFQVSGRHGEGQNEEMAIEALLDYQLKSGNNLVPLYNWLLDPGRYGIGWIGKQWMEEEVTVARWAEQQVTVFGIPTGKTKKVMTEETVKGYVGHRLFNIRPQDMLTDPRLPASQFQDGEFCARYLELGMHKVKQREADGYYFNIQAAQSASLNITNRDTGSPRVNLPNSDLEDYDYRMSERKTTFLRLHEFYWELIPRDWGLGESTRMQRWVFTIAGENVIIGCQPLGLYSNKYPFACLEYEVDAYPTFKRSLLEVIDPLNKTMEWLFNSHFYNVRAVLNNQLVVDPSRIEMKDLENPEPGKILRLKPLAYGTDPRVAVTQLPVGDITGRHLSEAGAVAEMLQRVSGVNDQVMGVMAGGRKTATEVRSSTNFGISRLKTNCEYFSAMGFAPLTQQLIQDTQQLYDTDRKFRVVGNLAQWARKYMAVGPEDIAGFFDYVPVDGTLPIDRFAQANLWQQILGGMTAMPQVAGAYDMPKIFAFVAQLAGLKNIDQFRVQLVPDEVALQQAQAGNLATIEPGNPVEPGQIPGLGATG